MFEDVFIAIYTHQCKSYCDDEFFRNLFQSDIGFASINIIDNTLGTNYFHDLYNKYGKRAYVDHVIVDRGDSKTQFLRNVEASLYGLRCKFLKGPYRYFVILESDVIPNDSKWLHYFMEVSDQADIIGGLYYHGFHSPDMWSGPARIILTTHVLSGCAMYTRTVIEQYIFRWSEDNINAFPDAWICYDAIKAGFRVANYTKIQCRHLTDANGGRGLNNIN